MKIKIYLKKRRKERTAQGTVIRLKNHASKANGESEEAKDVPSILRRDFPFLQRGGGEGDEKFLKIRRDVSSSASSRNVEPPSQYIIKRSPPSFLCHPAQERNVTRKSTVAAICPAIKIKRLRVNFFYVDGIILDDRNE